MLLYLELIMDLSVQRKVITENITKISSNVVVLNMAKNTSSLKTIFFYYISFFYDMSYKLLMLCIRVFEIYIS